MPSEPLTRSVGVSTSPMRQSEGWAPSSPEEWRERPRPRTVIAVGAERGPAAGTTDDSFWSKWVKMNGSAATGRGEPPSPAGASRQPAAVGSTPLYSSVSGSDDSAAAAALAAAEVVGEVAGHVRDCQPH